MTKTQKKTKQKVERNTPLNATRYQGFYLTMLILSTVGTAFGIVGLWGIVDTIALFNDAPVYAILSLINVLVVLPVAIWALILLWLKHPLGIWLKLGTYAVSIICAIGLLFSAGPVIKVYLAEALAEMAKRPNQSVDASIVEGIATIALYAGIALTIMSSIAFGLLWYFAWKKQSEADSE
jgi:hypothetical protein